MNHLPSANGKTVPPAATDKIAKSAPSAKPHLPGYMRHLRPAACTEEMLPQSALFCHIFMLNSVLERASNRVAEQFDLTLPQWMAMGCIGNGGEAGITHSVLGSRLMLSKAPITGVVDRLERAGYVTRVPDTQDRRVSRIVITDRGLETWLEVRQALRELAVAHCNCFSEQELDVLLSLLGRWLDVVAAADPILTMSNGTGLEVVLARMSPEK